MAAKIGIIINSGDFIFHLINYLKFINGVLQLLR